MVKSGKRRPGGSSRQSRGHTAYSSHSAAAACGERRLRSSDIRSQQQTSTAWECRQRVRKMDSCVISATLLAIGLYLNTLPAEFAYDDSRAIVKNPDLTGDTPLHQLFVNDFWGTPLTHSGSHKSYRPLCVLTFRLNYALGGLAPFGYHLGNVLLHAGATALFTHTVFLLTSATSAATTSGDSAFIARVAGLLFASHPIHTEAVAGVVGRADVLACCFFLLALQSYIRYCCHRDAPSHRDCANFTKTKELLLTTAFTMAAMLSKEQGVTVLAVCAVYDVFIHSRLTPKQLLTIYKQPPERRGSVLEGLLSLVTIGMVLIGGRVYLMGNKPPEFAPADNPASDSDSLLTRTLTFHYLPFLNAWLLLYPRVLSFDWSMEAVPLLESFTDLRNICTLTFYALLVYTFGYIVRNLNQSVGHCDSSASSRNGCHTPPHHVNGNGRTCHDNNGYVVHHPSSSSSISPSVPCTVRTNGTSPHHPGHVVRRKTRRGSTSSTDSNHSDDSSVGSVMSSTSSVHLAPRSLTAMHALILSLSLLVFPFIPATNLFFYVGFVIAERVLYIPSMGLCLLVAYGACIMRRQYGTDPQRRRLLHGVLAFLVLGYGFRTVLRNQDWSTEENLYRAGISVNPAKAWGNLANILNSKGDAGAAEDAYRAALLQRGNMADVHYNLGILLQEQKRYTEAVESYKMAIQCRPRLTMAYLNLGIVHTNLGRKEEAEKVYRHCAEIDISGLKDPRLHEQTKISALYNLGRLLADQERFHEATDMYKLAIQRRPQHYAPQSLYNMLGEAYFKLDQIDEAETWYQRALKAKPDHIPAHLTMGKLLHRKGDLSGAEDWFIKARMIDPKDGSVYQHYGQFLGEISRFKESADNYVKAAMLAPDDFELVFNAANALRQAGQHAEAEEFYRKAARISPKTATAHMNLGAMLHFNGKLAEAEASYLMALALKPDDSVTQANLKKLRNLMAKTGGGSR